MSKAARALTIGLAAALALGLTIVGPGGAAQAATPQAQSTGRFLDGSLGGNALQTIADVQDAHADMPGTASAQNPLDATVLQKLDVPLTGALQLPGGGVFTLGAANQVAQAHADGSSWGASGAVSNSGGLSLGGANGSFPADAKIDLSPAALSSAAGTLPIPGGSSLNALGGVTATIGAVSALAQTSTSGAGSANYDIANLTLTVGSPAVGGLLKTITSQSSALTALLAPVTAALGSALPAQCALTPGTLPPTISLDNGTVYIDPASGSLTIDLEALLETLHLNLNDLPANTDLISYLVQQLPTILSTGLENAVDAIINPLEADFTACLGALGPLAGVVGTLLSTLTSGEQSVEAAINQAATSLSTAGSSGMGALADGLKKVIDIGVNVQPNTVSKNAAAPFTSSLKPTADQASPVVAGQTIVRAIEVDLVGDPLASIALANAASGPAGATPTTPTSTSTPEGSGTPLAGGVPTGVNAGSAVKSPMPLTALWLALLGFGLAGAGGFAWLRRAARRA